MLILKNHLTRIVDSIPKEWAADDKMKNLSRLFGNTAGGLLIDCHNYIHNRNREIDFATVHGKVCDLFNRKLESYTGAGRTNGSHHHLEIEYVEGIATIAEFLHRVNGERPLSSSVMVLPVVRGSEKSELLSLASSADVGTRTLLTQEVPDSLHLWLRQAEDLVALQRVMFINRIFAALRAQISFVASALILLLLAFNLFPFQPLRLMMTSLGCLLAVILPITLWIFVRLERDEILSYIARTPPGRLTFTGPFVGRLMAYIGVPMLSFLVAQIPWLRTLFVEFITPTLMGLR
jgi:hypothetical protein